MPSCGKRLSGLREAYLAGGPVHLQNKPQGTAPTPLIPITLSTGADFVCAKLSKMEYGHVLFSLFIFRLGFAGCEFFGALQATYHHILWHTAKDNSEEIIVSGCGGILSLIIFSVTTLSLKNSRVRGGTANQETRWLLPLYNSCKCQSM